MPGNSNRYMPGSLGGEMPGNSHENHADGRPDIILLTERGLGQGAERGYAERLPGNGAILWGIGFFKKSCTAVCRRLHA